MPTYEGSTDIIAGGVIPIGAQSGENLVSLPAASSDLGSAGLNGFVGTDVVTPEIPGDLGTLYLDTNRFLLLAEARRENANFNGLSAVNLRFRGHREANKFNLMMQKLVTICGSLFLTLRTSNITLTTRESEDLYPTDTEIQTLYHIREQITFKEWYLLRDDNKRWYL